MKAVNLIPTELSVGDTTNKTANILKQASTIAGIISVVLIVSFIGIFVFYSFRVSDTVKTNDSLKQQVNSLSQSEQKLVFAKDRLLKIKEVKAKENSLNELEKYDMIFNNIKFDNNILISEVSIEPGQLEFSIISPNRDSISSFFDFLNNNKDSFDNVTVSTFSYAPTSGYNVGFVFESSK